MRVRVSAHVQRECETAGAALPVTRYAPCHVTPCAACLVSRPCVWRASANASESSAPLACDAATHNIAQYPVPYGSRQTHPHTHTPAHTHPHTHTHPRARARIGHKLRIDTHAHMHASTRIRAQARAHTRTHPRRHNRARASHHRAGPNPQRCMARISDRRTVITIAATSARRNPAQIRGRTGTLRASRPMAQLAALDVGVHRRAQPRLRTAET